MSDTFYHADKHGELNPGDTMTLEWPPQIKNDAFVRSLDSNEAVLQQEYPEGLSRHGARYAQSQLVSQEIPDTPGWDAMCGIFHFMRRDGSGGTHQTEPYIVQYEWMFEMVRRAEFADATSRFQSYFAWPTQEDAKQFINDHRSKNQLIYEVECEQYELRDMSLLEAQHFGMGLENAREYWRAETDSDAPKWEVLMEPPVKVVKRVV